jgi:adenine deaminase
MENDRAKKAGSEPDPPDTSDESVDLILRGGTVLNVYSGELIQTDVSVKDGRIWSVGSSSGAESTPTRVLDVRHKVVVPGYIDPHFHPWNIYNPLSFGEEACRLGTTTLVCDNLIFYMLMGVTRFEAFMDQFSRMPIRFFWFCRAVPQTPMVNEEELFSVNHIQRLLENPNVLCLGEITRWHELLRGNPALAHLAAYTKGLRKRVDGHTAGAKNAQLNGIARAGVESCHEGINGAEVLERLRLGFYVMLRESSLRQDLRDLLKTVRDTRVLTDRLMLTTDSSTPAFYDRFGINDHLIRIAIEEGIDPVTAYRMATINPAVYLGIEHEVGGIAPGRSADLLILEDLRQPTPELVVSRGRIVAERAQLVQAFPEPDWKRFFPEPSYASGTWRARDVFFKLAFEGDHIRFPTMRLVNPVITRTEWVDFDLDDGFPDLESRPGFCLSALVDRKGTWITNGILQGFGDGVEGLASSFNTATQILVIGRKPDAMTAALNRVMEIKGGIVACEKGEIVYELPLPLGGFMSDRPMKEIADSQRALQAFLFDRGYPFHDPLYTLIFLPNDFLPDVRINYDGIIDIKEHKVLWPRKALLKA